MSPRRRRRPRARACRGRGVDARCAALSGCRCVGVDCADGAATREACEDAHTGRVVPGACDAARWCDLDAALSCAGSGVCLPRPEACPELYAPVCGCDGVTYDNACFAQGGGTDTAYPGACASPADCRTLGCPGTSRCMAFLTATGVGWVRLPAGAVC